MRPLTRLATSAAAVALATTMGAPIAAADGSPTMTGSPMPFSPILKRCDFTNDMHVPSAGTGGGTATITRTGSTLIADVHLIVAHPDAPYNVRVIESPRSAANTCYPGDPGVGAGVINTDDGGNGDVTIQADVMPGATGAWVLLEGPPGNSPVLNGDFYTSDAITKI